MTGAQMIAAERLRQVMEEGWSSGHDDTHISGELAQAACAYASPHGSREKERMWPWVDGFRASDPTHSGRIKELVKAGALVAAEIDRLNRCGR